MRHAGFFLHRAGVVARSEDITWDCDRRFPHVYKTLFRSGLLRKPLHQPYFIPRLVVFKFVH